MAEQILTQARLKKIVHYDPLTGIFTWLVSLSNRVKVGDVIRSPTDYGYLCGRIEGRSYFLHRLAFLYMVGAFPPEQTDHINHDRTNNVWANLRSATNAENQRNCSQQTNNTSGHNGVYWDKRGKKWLAQIQINNKQKYLGLFTKKSEAVAARQRANLKYNFHKNHGSSPTTQAATI